jgi:hypothetical protein
MDTPPALAERVRNKTKTVSDVLVWFAGRVKPPFRGGVAKNDRTTKARRHQGAEPARSAMIVSAETERVI